MNPHNKNRPEPNGSDRFAVQIGKLTDDELRTAISLAVKVKGSHRAHTGAQHGTLAGKQSTGCLVTN